jgi:hypothetical protein
MTQLRRVVLCSSFLPPRRADVILPHYFLPEHLLGPCCACNTLTVQMPFEAIAPGLTPLHLPQTSGSCLSHLLQVTSHIGIWHPSPFQGRRNSSPAQVKLSMGVNRHSWSFCCPLAHEPIGTCLMVGAKYLALNLGQPEQNVRRFCSGPLLPPTSICLTSQVQMPTRQSDDDARPGHSTKRPPGGAEVAHSDAIPTATCPSHTNPPPHRPLN